MKKLSFAIIGAGAGGQSMAAILSEQGYRVRLHDIDTKKVDDLNRLGVIEVSGKIQAKAFPELVTADIGAVMQDVDAVMVVTTTDAHEWVADKIAPYLREGQVILLHPGHVCGALQFSKVIRKDHGFKGRLLIGETGDLMYAVRVLETGKPIHTGIKKTSGVATIPSGDVDELIEILKPAFPGLIARKNILETGLGGAGALIHPIPALMNIVRMDNAQNYDFYLEGISPGVAKLVTAADAERCAVGRALGLNPVSMVESLGKTYNLPQTDFYELIQNNTAYAGLKSPSSLSHRFVVEDVVCGLVPLASIGRELGVATPMMDAFIEIASVTAGRDYRKEGRTAEKLGLAGKSPAEITAMVS